MRRYLPIALLLLLGCGSTNPATKTDLQPSTEAPSKIGNIPEAVPSTGEVKTVDFDSASLGVSKTYWLYLPTGYLDSYKRYPVIYMLHGLGGSEENWVNRMKLADAADELALQAIVVMPDGDNSFYINSATEADYEKCLAQGSEANCVKTANYEDYIVGDLVSHIDSNYRTLAVREQRAIGGLSMGGFGALMLAMRHQEVFSSVASHSGVDALLYTGPYPYEKGTATTAADPVKMTKKMGAFGALFLSLFGPDLQNWQEHDPAFLVDSLSNGQLAIYIDCGTEDDFRLHNGASYLHELLEAKQIEHSFTLTAGRHNVAFWTDRIDDSLRFHSAHFAK